MSISQEFERAFRLHQQGKLREAFMRYDAVLAAIPTMRPAFIISGVVLFQAGQASGSGRANPRIARNRA
jgi:hypothetical protein